MMEVSRPCGVEVVGDAAGGDVFEREVVALRQLAEVVGRRISSRRPRRDGDVGLMREEAVIAVAGYVENAVVREIKAIELVHVPARAEDAVRSHDDRGRTGELGDDREVAVPAELGGNIDFPVVGVSFGRPGERPARPR